MRQRWFEPNLQKLLTEAGKDGLRINHIVRNICNMEPQVWRRSYLRGGLERDLPLSPRREQEI